MREDFFKDRLIKSIKENIESQFQVKGDIFADLELSKNIVDFAVNPLFLDVPGIYQNKGQYYVLREFFGLRCPNCNDQSEEAKLVWDKDENYLRNEILLEWDSEKSDFICPNCNISQRELIELGKIEIKDTLLGVVGMKAGKTMLASIIMAYFEHFLIKQGNLRKYFGLEKAPFFEISAVAVSDTQAEQTIWAQYLAIRDNSEWFRRFEEIIRDHRLDKLGKYIKKSSEIKNDINGLLIQSLNSSSASLAGRAKVLYVMDELGRFDTTESKRSAKEVWQVGQSSLKPVRKSVMQRNLPYWLGAFIAVGSPISVEDFGMKKLQEVKNKNDSRIWAIHSSTWEFNRQYTKEDFEEDFNEDFIMAQRDFGAQPVGTEVPFFDNWELFLKAGEKGLKPKVIFADENHITDDGITYLGKVILQVEQDSFDHFICGDAGKSKDTFGLVSVHIEEQEVNGIKEWVTVQDFALHILPNANLKRFVWFESIEEILKRLALVWKVKKISFDYWDTDSIVQELKVNQGLDVEQYAMSALRVEDFNRFKKDLYRGKIWLLPKTGDEDGDPKLMDSQTRLYWEAKRMERSKDLKKVDHSKRSTSDLIESLVNCHRLVRLYLGGEQFIDNKVSKKEQIYRQERVTGGQFIGSVVRFRRW